MKVFVYGTLKKGGSNYYILKKSKYLGEHTIKGTLYCCGRFPMLNKGVDTIKGELYEVNEATMRSLDMLEANGSMYKRELVDGVWVYFFMRNLENERSLQRLYPNKDGVVDWVKPIWGRYV